MKTIARFLLPLCLFAFACGGAPKPAPEPPPAVAPEPPPPAWEANAENCGEIASKLIELAKAAKMDSVAKELEDNLDKMIADCAETMNEEQFKCVMAATEFKALDACQSDEESDEE